MPGPRSSRSIAAWNDDAPPPPAARCIAKFAQVLPISRRCSTWWNPTAVLSVDDVKRDDKILRATWASQNLCILPGSYLARDTQQPRPEPSHISLIAPVPECITPPTHPAFPESSRYRSSHPRRDHRQAFERRAD
jgi:N-succinyldiaminopimelate aminotransferase